MPIWWGSTYCMTWIKIMILLKWINKNRWNKNRWNKNLSIKKIKNKGNSFNRLQMGRIRWAETNYRNFSQIDQRLLKETLKPGKMLTEMGISEEKSDKMGKQKVEMRTWAAIIIAALRAAIITSLPLPLPLPPFFMISLPLPLPLPPFFMTSLPLPLPLPWKSRAAAAVRASAASRCPITDWKWYATFRTQTLARRNYLAELPEILHGTLLGDSAWDSWGVFGNLFWGLRYGVPKESWGWAKIFEK